MGPATTDRRVRRTQEAIRKAFQSLLEEKGYDAVTVQDILNRADVGRSTFYTHYRDKEHLLLTGFDDIRFSLAAEGHTVLEQSAERSELLGPTLAVFEHVGRYRHTWKPLVRKGGAEVVARILRDTAERGETQPRPQRSPVRRICLPGARCRERRLPVVAFGSDKGSSFSGRWPECATGRVALRYGA